ncbi:hypothetical protein D3C87_676250 [compost metagenome]|jgi:hypothetical protein
MDQRIIYQCNVLKGINKVGDLKKLDNGYYEVRLGALGAYNEAGWLYNEREGRQLLEGSAGLMRMINQNNALRGENGHPRFQAGMNQLQWFGRVNDIFEPNVCFHMRRLMLDPAKDERGRSISMVLGEVRASGKESAWFDKQLENRDENVCFSIRSFTEDKIVGGVKTKFLKKIVTWDTVNEPGIRNSSKYATPSLESAPQAGGGMIALPEAELETVFYADALRKEAAANPIGVGAGVGFESGANMMSLIAEIERPIRVYVPSAWRW